jgi:predicted secreted protein
MSNAVAGFRCDVYISLDGTNGSFQILGEMRNSNVTINQEPIDVTSYSTNGWLEYIIGLRSWEASTDGLYVYNDAGLVLVQNWLLDAATYQDQNFPTFLFVPKRGVQGRDYFKGTASINNFDIGIAYTDSIQTSISLTGSGEIIKESLGVAGAINEAA